MLGIKDVTQVQECPACASLNIVSNPQREQVVCKDCGVIFQPTPLLEIPVGQQKQVQKKKAVPKKKSKKK